MKKSPEQRYGDLSRGVLILLSSAPDGLAKAEVLDRLAAAVPPAPSALRAFAQ